MHVGALLQNDSVFTLILNDFLRISRIILYKTQVHNWKHVMLNMHRCPQMFFQGRIAENTDLLEGRQNKERWYKYLGLAELI